MKVFAALLLMMIAEEVKEGTRVGKRVKRLAYHQVLKEGMAPKVVADLMRGKSAEKIMGECIKRGI